MDVSVFASPRRGVHKEDCFFYHVNEIPGVGQVGEHWDSRATIEDYLGHYDYSGRRVLDVGTASGYLTFEMEKRGADVVSFDVENARVIEIVPFHNDSSTIDELWVSPRDWIRQAKELLLVLLLVLPRAPQFFSPGVLRQYLPASIFDRPL